MSQQQDNNKRIAKNTLFLYLRQIFVMAVALYTSRVVLATLGVIDYGIYNVVGGVVAMFSFINAAMTTSTQRFLTFELGKKDYLQLAKVFAASLNVHYIIGLVGVFLGETIGLWFLNYELNIPADRMTAANWVYQCSVLSFFLSITQVPYNASIVSHEKMNIFAYFSIIDVVLKLLIVYLLVISPFDKLIFYAILILAVTTFSRLLYRFYCRKHFKECRPRLFWDKSLYQQLTGFAGWNLLGSIAWLLRGQGMDIVINLFFGPALNAAKGVANSVTNAVNTFVSNFMTALNPQITKNYAQKDINTMETLCYRACRYSFILLFAIAFPLIMNIDFVLGIWLVEVPKYTAIFVILIIADSLVNAALGSSPFITAMMATGNIRNYQIVVSLIIMMIIPISYVILKLGGNPPSIFYVMILISFISDIARFYYCNKQIGFKYSSLIKHVILPIVCGLIVALPIPILLRETVWVKSNWINFFGLCVICEVTLGIAAYYIIIEKHERTVIMTAIKNKLLRVIAKQ